jgi:hypothetical protein
MAELTADFEAGSNGATVTTGAGEASADAWTTVTIQANSDITYSNTQTAGGALSAKFDHNSIDSGALLLGWDHASIDDLYGRLYIYMDSHIGVGWELMKVRRSGGGQVIAMLKLDSTGHLLMTDTTGGTIGTFTNALGTGAWNRIEYHIGVNSFEAKLFTTATSETATETQTKTGTVWDQKQTVEFTAYGGGGTAQVFYLDEIVHNATSYPGPVAGAGSQTLLASADSVDGAWTDQSGGSSLAAAIDEATASDADYIHSEDMPSASGTRVKLATGDDPLSSTGHDIHWRIRKIGTATIDMTVKLYQGGGDSLGAGTLIASFDRTDVSTTFTEFTETLSSGEADSITDYSDLYLEFVADVP